MPAVREVIKRVMPVVVRDALISARERLAAPPLEDIALHEYDVWPEPGTVPRLTLVIPSVAPKSAFGGVTTGLELVLEIARRTNAEVRVLLDDFDRTQDYSVVRKCAQTIGVDLDRINIVPRQAWVPRIGVRENEVFCAYTSWTALNIHFILREQVRLFGGKVRPYLYIIQEYEPLFYPMSSTHMLARAAFDPVFPCWGLINSSELNVYLQGQGHCLAQSFVFEPKLSARLRPFLAGDPPTKVRRILVYGRPTIPRNCFPAIEKGLRAWAKRYQQFSAWEVTSAGVSHPPVAIGHGRVITSRGKLSIEDYGELLKTSAVGLSLMASPHPSYPPLEMAHFGLKTVTNSYANKNLADSHPNIIATHDISPDAIAAALAEACSAFEADPDGGWGVKTGRPSFLDVGAAPCLAQLADNLKRGVWAPAL